MPDDERLRELATHHERKAKEEAEYTGGLAEKYAAHHRDLAAVCRAVIAAREAIAGRDHPIAPSVLRAILSPGNEPPK